MMGRLTAPSPPPRPNPSAAKFVSQGDAHVRTDTQNKILYYPLIFPRTFLQPVNSSKNSSLYKVKKLNLKKTHHETLQL